MTSENLRTVIKAENVALEILDFARETINKHKGPLKVNQALNFHSEVWEALERYRKQ